MKKLLRRRFGSAVCTGLALFLCACPASHGQSATTPSPDAAAFREVVDEAGRTVRMPQAVRRIVSLAPSLTETIYALGLQDRLVGDTNYCDYPPEAQKKTKVGGGINPSLEMIASLRPDLVLVAKSYNRLETTQSLDVLGIPSYAIDPHSVDDVIASTKTLARMLGVPEAGTSVASDMQRRLGDLLFRVGAMPPKHVLFVVWTQPLISTGRNTFLADALRYAGAISIVDSAQDWPQVNMEEVAKLQPDYLVFADSHAESVSREVETLATLPGWKILNAVSNRRYAVISDAVNRPAPRIVSAIEELARQLHPEVFGEKPAKANERIDRGSPLVRPLQEGRTGNGGCACGR